MESLPNWLKTAQPGKARKAANDDGETERLKKRGREKHARRGMKEVERMRRYEESMRRRDKLVKKDKRRSEMANRVVTERYNIGRMAKNENNCKPGRWQVGDGSRKELEMVEKGNVERKEQEKRRKNNSDNELKGGKFGQCRKAVKINVKNISGKDRTREWVQIMETEKNSTERCLIDRSWARHIVPQEESKSETSHQKSAEEGVDDITPSWPISRFCFDETPYFPIKKPFTAVNIIDTRADIQGTAFQDNPDKLAVNPITVTLKNKKSVKSRIVSVFRYLSRRARGKTV